jgi:holo-[acyl-carrier protein] synthase
MGIKGVGVDIIEIDRIKEAVKKFGSDFLNKVFTDKEISYCSRRKALKYPELAARFAAKEAYSKAIGKGIAGLGRKNNGVRWKDVEVINNSFGKPLFSIRGNISQNAHVSLSHSRDYAVAFVYVEE